MRIQVINLPTGLFFGHKTDLVMTEEHIITAAVITSGERGDGSELPKFLEISWETELM